MKQVIVKDKFDTIIDYTMLENIDDLLEYQESINRKVTETISRLLRSDGGPERWDHMIGRDDEGGVMSAAIATANIRGGNPVYLAGELVNEKLRSFLRIIDGGEIILVNERGGYCTLTEGYHTIVEQNEVSSEPKPSHVIPKNTRYINLENDPDLEQHTIDYLEKVDPFYSHITRLRNYSPMKLREVFKEFMANGGTHVYVYTTGIDVDQMMLYSRAIIDSGLKTVEFEFNAGMTDGIDGVIEFLRKNSVYVKIILPDPQMI